MKRTALFFVLACLGMGGQRPTIPDASLPSPEPFREKFQQQGAQYGAAFVTQTVSLSFRSFFGATVGMCSFNSSGRNHVDLSSSAWQRGSNTFREMLVYHELGHCLLGRGHKNSKLTSGQPESLMNSWMFDERTYLANRDYYLKELFTAENHRNRSSFMAAERVRDDDCGFHFPWFGPRK